MIKRSAIAAFAIAICAVSCGGGDGTGGEETVVMVSGSYRTVGDGRAEILVGEIGDLWREDLGRLVDAIEVEVSCAEEKTVVWATMEQMTEPVCRVQVELEEIVTWSPPKVRLRVVWSGQ